MDIDTAKKIVADLIRVKMLSMGLDNTEIPDVSGYSLADMIEANRVVEGLNKAEKERIDGAGGTRTIHMTVDDRLVAAIYTAQNYDPPLEGGPLGPIAVIGDRAVVVVKCNVEEGEG